MHGLLRLSSIRTTLFAIERLSRFCSLRMPVMRATLSLGPRSALSQIEGLQYAPLAGLPLRQCGIQLKSLVHQEKEPTCGSKNGAGSAASQPPYSHRSSAH